MVRLARIPLKAVGTEVESLDLALADLAPAAGRLPAGNPEPFSGVIKWSDSCIGRARSALEEALRTRRRQGRTATREEEERQRSIH
jgi:hypothetical protein